MKHVLIQGGNAVVAEVQAPMVSAKNILVLCSRFMFAPCKVHSMTATTSKAIAADVPEYARPENLPFQSGGFIRLAFFLGLMSFVRRLDEFVLSVREPVIAPLRQCRKGLEIGARGKTFGTVVDSFFRPGFGLVHKTAHLVEVESELLPLRAKPGPSGESLWAISTAPSPASSKRPPSSLDKCAMSFCFSGPNSSLCAILRRAAHFSPADQAGENREKQRFLRIVQLAAHLLGFHAAPLPLHR
jgi:hypothetical protein